jgi:hypothetical protein
LAAKSQKNAGTSPNGGSDDRQAAVSVLFNEFQQADISKESKDLQPLIFAALKQVGFDYEKTKTRGGEYIL